MSASTDCKHYYNGACFHKDLIQDPGMPYHCSDLHDPGCFCEDYCKYESRVIRRVQQKADALEPLHTMQAWVKALIEVLPTRELSIALTKLEEAELWLERYRQKQKEKA